MVYSDISPKLVSYSNPSIEGTKPIDSELVNISLPDYDFIDGKRFIGYEIENDEEAIKNSLLNLFIIQTQEVPGKPEFGNPLNLVLFDLFDFFSVEVMKTKIKALINQYEPRVNIEDITIQSLPEYNRIIINLYYSYIVNDNINYSSLALPYSHNTISYLGGRRVQPNFGSRGTNCQTRINGLNT